MYYSSIGILSILIHFIINHDYLRVKPEIPLTTAGKSYRTFLYAVLIYYLSDVGWGVLYEHGLIVLTYIDTTIYFLSMVLSVLLWTQFVVTYLEWEGFIKKILLISGWTIFLFEVAVLVINFFVPIVFSFTGAKEYYPGQARYITLFAQMILYFAVSAGTLAASFKSEGSTKSHYRTIGFSGIIMTVFIALQSLYPLMPFYAIGCMLATCMIHSYVYRDKIMEYAVEMGATKNKAYKDPLTGVKNKLAYIEALVDIENGITEGTKKEFGVAVFDVNDLKKINDRLGHDAGDDYIKNACNMICQQFKHSPVFRIGGDEFVAILEGDDYRDREPLMRCFNKDVDENIKSGNVVVAGGFGEYDPENNENYNDVFKRADRKMYERKEQLKQKD
ncbi:MAG: GGDEF domain-containing protein [Lachnospiraceae bacterium]|nr:GGDEF domain-containing protein [Lachnospiraceae bacterium]